MRKQDIFTQVGAAIAVALAVSCTHDDSTGHPVITDRDAQPVLRSTGVSTLISDSGIIRYKIIAEEWWVYDRTDTTKWAFEKGIFLEKFNEQFHVDAFITADTAYYYDELRLWELRGRVQVKNLKGETFRTSILFWNQNEHRVYSHAFMRIDGIEQQLSGYDFTSDEQMNNYLIHSSVGAFPMGDSPTRQLPTDSDASLPNDSASIPTQADNPTSPLLGKAVDSVPGN